MDFTTIMLVINAAIFGYLLGCFREMYRSEGYYRPLLDERAESLEKAYREIDRLKRAGG